MPTGAVNVSEILFHAHSGLRYLVLLVGVLSFGYSLVALARKRPWDRPGRGLLSAFVGVMDLQLLIGLVLVFVWNFYPALWGHIAMMVLAVAVGHVASVINKRRPPERQSHAVAAIGAAGSLLLIIGGITAIGRPLF
jgi:predicted lipid-binding transport protein (Tim44 family)